MKIQFGETISERRALFVQVTGMKTGDLLELGESLFRVGTVQPQCPQWETRRTFTIVILNDDKGKEFSTRKLEGKQKVWRR